MIRHAIVVAALALSASGCAHTVNMALRPGFDDMLSVSDGLAAIAPPLTLAVAEVTDRRPDTTRLTVFKQGMHTFNVYGERPFGDAVVEGLQALFTRAGHAWTDGTDARVLVGVQILNVQTARNAGFVKVGATSSVQIRIEFTEGRTGRALHSEVYNGTDERDQALVGLMGMVRASLDQALVNCIDNVGKDVKLAAILRNLGT